MSKTQHSPSPWAYSIITVDGQRLIEIVDALRREIVRLPYSEVNLSNARLFVAAPNMLDMLGNVKDVLTAIGWNPEKGMLLQIIETIAEVSESHEDAGELFGEAMNIVTDLAGTQPPADDAGNCYFCRAAGNPEVPDGHYADCLFRRAAFWSNDLELQ